MGNLYSPESQTQYVFERPNFTLIVCKSYQLYCVVFQIALVPMVRLYRCANSDKYPEVSVVLSTASSFFVFFFLHGSVVLARHLMDASAIQMSTYHSWMIKVIHQKDVTLKSLGNFHKLCVGWEVCTFYCDSDGRGSVLSQICIQECSLLTVS